MKNNNETPDNSSELSGEVVKPVMSSRRRLFRQGAAVVAVTLASRPVLAWHCKAPSAWGSEMINPNTSLAGNDGHKSYTDETWAISNWKANTARASLGNPWNKLKLKYPAFGTDASLKTNGSFDYRKVTVAKLFSDDTGLTRPSGFNNSDKVYMVLNTGRDFKTYALVAQLNFILLQASTDIDRCISLQNIQLMASGSYPLPRPVNPPVAGDWGQEDIMDYLYNNWIVRP